MRVLLAIVEVCGALQVAEALGIGEGTVKTHLKRLYQKTGEAGKPIWSSCLPATPIRW